MNEISLTIVLAEWEFYTSHLGLKLNPKTHQYKKMTLNKIVQNRLSDKNMVQNAPNMVQNAPVSIWKQNLNWCKIDENTKFVASWWWKSWTVLFIAEQQNRKSCKILNESSHHVLHCRWLKSILNPFWRRFILRSNIHFHPTKYLQQLLFLIHPLTFEQKNESFVVDMF